MRTVGAAAATYLGVDLTDAYARMPRAIDVCGLEVVEGALVARFWTWTYDDGGTRDVSSIVAEIRAARGAVLDGPHALAAQGATMRACERATAAAGKTPDVLPSLAVPFGGFVRSSVELFRSLDAAGVHVVTAVGSAAGGVAEQYPGGNWARLVKGTKLPKKKSVAGVAARRAILETLGVVFPGGMALRDDHLDACLGAVIAAAADGAVAGASVLRVGEPLVRDAEGVLREGQIWLLDLDAETRAHVVSGIAE